MVPATPRLITSVYHGVVLIIGVKNVESGVTVAMCGTSNSIGVSVETKVFRESSTTFLVQPSLADLSRSVLEGTFILLSQVKLFT